MEILRFGVGFRRPDGPPGTRGVTGQTIHADARGVISELALARSASIEPHRNPNSAWFICIEGGGFVQVEDERERIAAGEAVLWPADAMRGASTELSEMRAIVVEFAGPDDEFMRGIIEGRVRELEAGNAAPGQGALAPRPRTADEHDESEGEPF